MQERAKRPSRLVQSIARWAITCGVAGTIVGGTAMYGVLLRAELPTSKHTALVLSGALLSVAFVLAPFVRRTFGFAAAKRKPAAARTLLDEMREAPPPLDGAAPAAPAQTVAATPRPAPPALAARLVTAAYVMFGAMLLSILWALQTN